MLGMAAVPFHAFRQQLVGGARTAPARSALTLAQFLNKTRYSDLPPKAIRLHCRQGTDESFEPANCLDCRSSAMHGFEDIP
jgi:hypothetical protein